MAPRKKQIRRRPKFTGFKVTDTLFDFYDANQLTTLFSNQGIIPTFIAPFLPGYTGATAADGGLDLKEVWMGLTETGLFHPGSAAGGAWVGAWSGAPSTGATGLGGTIMKNMQANGCTNREESPNKIRSSEAIERPHSQDRHGQHGEVLR
jgi:hypothetical protein